MENSAWKNGALHAPVWPCAALRQAGNKTPNAKTSANDRKFAEVFAFAAYSDKYFCAFVRCFAFSPCRFSGRFASVKFFLNRPAGASF